MTYLHAATTDMWFSWMKNAIIPQDKAGALQLVTTLMLVML